MEISLLNKKLVSCDIFDTLIYRMTSVPEQIFTIVQEEYQRIYDEHLEYDYLHLRKFSESSVRKKTPSREVKHIDIIDNLPFSPLVKDRLAELEFNIEKKYLVLNEEIYKFLLHCKAQDIVVVLVSDMYFSQHQVKEILYSLGCDLSIFDEIFVSSDYKASKANGELYTVLKSRYKNIHASEILHIGDNYYSDIIMASNEDIESFHYTKFLEGLDSIYALEEGWCGESISELRSLRKKVSIIDHGNSNYKLYNLGAQIFGPVISIYIDWVIDYAVKTTVKTICTWAFEGELLERMLKTAIEKRKLNISVDSLHVSKKSTYLSSLNTFDHIEKNNLLKRNDLKVGDLFDLLMIQVNSTIFEDYKEKLIRELADFLIEGKSMYDILDDYLDKESIVLEINNNIATQKELLRSYVEGKVNNNEFMTVSLAEHGPIQLAIDKVLHTTARAYHLALLSKLSSLKKVIEGHCFLAWLGYDEATNHKINQIFNHYKVIESVFYSTEQNVSHYLIADSEAAAACNDKGVPEESKDMRELIWDGIIEFQLEWLDLDERKSIKHIVMRNREAVLNILYRLIQYPLYEEARLIGVLQHSAQDHKSLISQEDLIMLRERGVNELLDLTNQHYSQSKVNWPQGIVAMEHPNYFLLKYFKEKKTDPSYSKIHTMISTVAQGKYQKICVYGAGVFGKKVLTLAKAYDIQIHAFIDQNHLKIKDYMEGVPVKGIEFLDDSVDLVIVGSQAFYKEISDTIMEHYNHNNVPRIIGIS